MSDQPQSPDERFVAAGNDQQTTPPRLQNIPIAAVASGTSGTDLALPHAPGSALAKPNNRWVWTLLGIFAAFGFLFCGGILTLVYFISQIPAPWAERGPAGEAALIEWGDEQRGFQYLQIEDLRRSALRPEIAVDAATEKEINAAIQELSNLAADKPQQVKRISVAGYLQQMERSQKGEALGFLEKSSIALEFSTLTDGPPAFQNFKVHSIERLGDNELIVSMFVWNSPEGESSVRWWMVKVGDQWKLSDWMFVDDGLSEASRYALINSLQDDRNIEEFYSIQSRVVNVTADNFQHVLEVADDARVPSGLHDLLQYQVAQEWLSFGEYQKTQKVLEDVRRPEQTPGTLMLRAKACAAERKHGQAIVYGERYLSIVGRSPPIERVLAECHIALGDFHNAEKYWALVLQDFPEDWSTLLSISSHLEMVETESLERLAEASPRVSEFPLRLLQNSYGKVRSDVARRFLSYSSGPWSDPGLKHLLQAIVWEHQFQYDQAAEAYLACLSVTKAETDEGGNRGESASDVSDSEGTNDADSEAIPDAISLADLAESLLFNLLIQMDKPQEAYAAASDKENAFDTLYYRYVETANIDAAQMQDILNLHMTIQREDPWLLYYQAVLAFENGAPQLARRLIEENKTKTEEEMVLNSLLELETQMAVDTATEPQEVTQLYPLDFPLFTKIANKLKSEGRFQDLQNFCNDSQAGLPEIDDSQRLQINYFSGLACEGLGDSASAIAAYLAGYEAWTSNDSYFHDTIMNRVARLLLQQENWSIKLSDATLMRLGLGQQIVSSLIEDRRWSDLEQVLASDAHTQISELNLLDAQLSLAYHQGDLKLCAQKCNQLRALEVDGFPDLISDNEILHAVFVYWIDRDEPAQATALAEWVNDHLFDSSLKVWLLIRQEQWDLLQESYETYIPLRVYFQPAFARWRQEPSGVEFLQRFPPLLQESPLAIEYRVALAETAEVDDFNMHPSMAMLNDFAEVTRAKDTNEQQMWVFEREVPVGTGDAKGTQRIVVSHRVGRIKAEQQTGAANGDAWRKKVGSLVSVIGQSDVNDRAFEQVIFDLAKSLTENPVAIADSQNYRLAVAGIDAADLSQLTAGQLRRSQHYGDLEVEEDQKRAEANAWQQMRDRLVLLENQSLNVGDVIQARVSENGSDDIVRGEVLEIFNAEEHPTIKLRLVESSPRHLHLKAGSIHRVNLNRWQHQR